MKCIIRLCVKFSLLITSLAFGDSNLVAIHNATPLPGEGYLVIQLMDIAGGGKICGFMSTTPVKKGSSFSVNLNNINQYKKYLKNCSQEDVKTILHSIAPAYFVSVRYESQGLITCNDYESIHNATMIIESYSVPFAECKA